MTRLHAVALVVFCGALAHLRSMETVPSYGAQAALGAQEPSDRSWSPGVQKAPETSPPLSPADEMKHFYLPPGYRVELVASEPLVQDPIAVDWDADGRLWVVEYPEYVRNLTDPEPNLEPIGRIAVLEDTDNDGKMDKRTVFADGLVQGRSVKALDHGILVHEPPDIWLMKDTNGDLKMDTKEKVGTDHGRRDGSVEGNANTLRWGLDNYLHSAGSSVSSQLRLKDGTWAVAPDVGARRMGRRPGRLRPDIPQLQRVDTPGGSRADAVLRAKPDADPHPRQLRDPHERCEQPQRGVAGATQPRHQPFVPVSASCGRPTARSFR